jgi:copper chaperone NosL
MKLLSAFILTCGVAILVMLASCQKTAMEPVAIEANDMCSFCRMSISEKRYAAELIDNDGQAFKFDDIGCMANFIRQKKSNVQMHASFVMNFDRREWLKAESAFYVRSSQFKTPMNGGIVAFKDQSSADAAVAEYKGTLVSFAEITK